MLAVANRHKFKINLNSIIRNSGFYNLLKKIFANPILRINYKMTQ